MKMVAQKWLSRFFEHGILAALGAVADQWEAMNAMRMEQRRELDDSNDDDLIQTEFEYLVLAAGLGLALVVFACERFAGGQ